MAKCGSPIYPGITIPGHNYSNDYMDIICLCNLHHYPIYSRFKTTSFFYLSLWMYSYVHGNALLLIRQ